MTVFSNKKTFNSLGLEQVQQSHAHASQDCTICLDPLAVHPTKIKLADTKLHTAVRIAACGHIIGQECLDAWLDVGHTCPTCDRLLFEATGDPITQHDIDKILRTLGPEFGEDAIMVVVARRMARQEEEHARRKQAHEMEMEKEKMKAEEMQAKSDGFALSDEDFLDSDEELDFGEDDDDDEEYEEEEEALI